MRPFGAGSGCAYNGYQQVIGDFRRRRMKTAVWPLFRGAHFVYDGVGEWVFRGAADIKRHCYKSKHTNA